PGGIPSAAEYLPADIHQIVRRTCGFEHAGDLVHRVAFGYRVEPYLHLRILLDEPPVPNGYLFVTHVAEQRVRVDSGRLLPACEAVSVHKGLYGDVVAPSGEFAHAAGEFDVADDVLVERIGF